jgi:regulator of sirC expression with transglutaminase-like and TPR domain
MTLAQRTREFVEAAAGDDPESLVHAATLIGRVEYPHLDPDATLARFAEMGREAAHRLGSLADFALHERFERLNQYLFDELGFAGNEKRYDDPRNSFLHEVVERRTGIPISLAVVYIDVARRAGLALEGVNFPGHFLVRYAPGPDRRPHDRELLIDAFHRGAFLTELDTRRLLEQHVGTDASLTPDMLAAAGKQETLVRMLTNLKRLYVRSRSFPQAHEITSLLVALDADALTEIRDRGLLAYQLHDLPAALRDLETYLQRISHGAQQIDEEKRREYEQVWEHAKAIRRRMASLN